MSLIFESIVKNKVAIRSIALYISFVFATLTLLGISFVYGVKSSDAGVLDTVSETYCVAKHSPVGSCVLWATEHKYNICYISRNLENISCIRN